jgi:hypothetical protein
VYVFIDGAHASVRICTTYFTAFSIFRDRPVDVAARAGFRSQRFERQQLLMRESEPKTWCDRVQVPWPALSIRADGWRLGRSVFDNLPGNTLLPSSSTPEQIL